MTTELYVPTVEIVRDAVSFPRERLGEPRPISREAFERFIAHVKTDALREAKADLDERALRINDAEHRFGVELASSLLADRIKEEA